MFKIDMEKVGGTCDGSAPTLLFRSLGFHFFILHFYISAYPYHGTNVCYLHA